MDPTAFESLINEIDGTIKAVEEQRKAQQQIDALSSRRKYLAHQAEAFPPRLEKLAALGLAEPLAKAKAAVDGLQREIAEIDRQLAAIQPKAPAAAPAPAVAPPPKAARQEHDIQHEAQTLVDEVDGVVPHLAGFSPERRVLQFTIWAQRYKLLALQSSNQRTLNWVYARIREGMKAWPDLPYIDALNSAATGDWAAELAKSQKELALVEDREKRKRLADETFDALKAVPARFVLPEDPEGIRELQRCVKACAQFVSRREELATAVAPYRESLGKEFAFLWPSDDAPVEEEARERKSRRELLVRVLERMYRLKEIGGKHTSFNNVYRGIGGGHDLGTAKEGGELLIREGVLFPKHNNGDLHVSIEPKRVRDVERFLDGGSLGSDVLDAWLKADPA
jgi:chorismate mutase